VTRDEQDIGLQIKLERVAQRLRQRELAVRTDLSPSTLSDIENGWRWPSQDEIQRICAALGIRPDDLGVGE